MNKSGTIVALVFVFFCLIALAFAFKVAHFSDESDQILEEIKLEPSVEQDRKSLKLEAFELALNSNVPTSVLKLSIKIDNLNSLEAFKEMLKPENMENVGEVIEYSPYFNNEFSVASLKILCAKNRKLEKWEAESCLKIDTNIKFVYFKVLTKIDGYTRDQMEAVADLDENAL